MMMVVVRVVFVMSVCQRRGGTTSWPAMHSKVGVYQLVKTISADDQRVVD